MPIHPMMNINPQAILLPPRVSYVLDNEYRYAHRHKPAVGKNFAPKAHAISLLWRLTLGIHPPNLL